MKIVVTGGGGFIGSHIVDAYIALGHEVFVIDDFSTGDRRNLNPRASLHALSILDSGIPALLARINPDILNHHAAQMNVRYSVSDPAFDARVNILGFLNVLEGCKELGIKKVIYASSGGAIYGEQDLFPAPEDHPTRPMSPYGVSKLAGEYYLFYYHQTLGTPYIALRYANIYGPRQNAEGEAGVIAIFIRQLLQSRSPTINGDGKQTRDYLYVGDVVEANVKALESSFTGALNIGTGHETDVLTLFQLLSEKIGSKAAAVHGPAKLGEQRRSSLDSSRARQVLGWSARILLSEGLDRTIAHCRQAGFR